MTLILINEQEPLLVKILTTYSGDKGDGVAPEFESDRCNEMKQEKDVCGSASPLHFLNPSKPDV